MNDQNLWPAIAEQIGAARGSEFTIVQHEAIRGGCINEAYVVSSTAERYFVKLNEASRLAMFEAEAQGLEEIVATRSLHAPQPLAFGLAADKSFLVMEYFKLRGNTQGSAELFGQQLATMHHFEQKQFGWCRDNTIGSTAQINTPMNDWADFWIEQRLGCQFDLAARQGYGGRLQQRGEQLMVSCAGLLVEHRPGASLLHGDLWSGNTAITQGGEPFVFDPAVYYGDREADIAMTELFGGFSPSFYAAYNEAWPLDEGYVVRKTLYNLYHILNHLNLFGVAYQAQAEHMIDRLLAELG